LASGDAGAAEWLIVAAQAEFVAPSRPADIERS
jgi:hypothetical protein